MAQVETWDYPNRRFYLSFDTVASGVDFILAYGEERAYRRLNESARKFLPMLQAQGNIPKGGGKFTPRYTVLLDGARAVPYDTSHTLTMLTEPITDDELSGAQVFDRLPLTDGVEVNIDVGYSQVEIITVVTGDGGFTNSDRSALNTLYNATTAGTGATEFSTAALANAPATGGGLGPEDIERLERIEYQLIADEKKGASRYQRLLPGTDTVILDKDVVFDPVEGFTITEHEEPPP